MARFMVRVTAALGVLLAMGCISILDTGDEDGGARRSESFDATYDEVWDAAIETFAELRLPIATLEKESGVITTDWILIDDPGDVMDCDDGDEDAEGRINVFVRRATEGPTVTVNGSFRAEDAEGDRHACRSTGEYEDDILRHIRDEL